MMATTHVLAGVALAAAALVVAPEHTTVAVVAGAVGGMFPDLDIYAGHRKTLHYPVCFPVAAVPALGMAVVVPTELMVAAAFFLAAAGAHSAMDALGGGLELRPWLATSERAVYDHVRGRWIAPRRWVRYDGAPEDLALAGVFGMFAASAFGGLVAQFVLAVLVGSLAYAFVRKPMVRITEYLVGRLPAVALPYVPERFVAG